jgi:hypothetical protein
VCLDILCGIAAAGIFANAADTTRWENVNTSVPNAPLRLIGSGVSLAHKQLQKQHKSVIGKQRADQQKAQLNGLKHLCSTLFFILLISERNSIESTKVHVQQHM